MIGKKLLTAFIGGVMCLCMMGSMAFASGQVVDGSELIGASSSTSHVFLVEDHSIDFGTPAITSEPVFPLAGSETVILGPQPIAVPYGTYLAEGGCTISKMEDNIARVEGYTNCYRQAEYVYLGLYMDRLENGSWHTVWYKDVSAEDTYSLYYAVNVLVQEGHYYRLRAAHIVQNGTVREGNSSFTDGIPFGNVN